MANPTPAPETTAEVAIHAFYVNGKKVWDVMVRFDAESRVLNIEAHNSQDRPVLVKVADEVDPRVSMILADQLTGLDLTFMECSPTTIEPDQSARVYVASPFGVNT